ncbi:hypothetical protein IQ22_03123 [Pseudomonas duriflava]|uniref:Uncharacterized protein n=1 Tax=Pseudomonas duriflava TaxID=459528 RepID=A0A562Q7M1_9PSED|nr:hypothetical protein IQ22_03123 [Pseudomonas duriflava]
MRLSIVGLVHSNQAGERYFTPLRSGPRCIFYISACLEVQVMCSPSRIELDRQLAIASRRGIHPSAQHSRTIQPELITERSIQRNVP